MLKILMYENKRDLEAITETLNLFKEENQKKGKGLDFPLEYYDIAFYKEKVLGIKDTIIAKENGKILGFAVAHPHENSSDTYWLRIIYVAPNNRGKDIATNLMDKFLNTAFEKGYKKAQSKVSKDNAYSIKLHRKKGFYNDRFLNDDRYYLMSKRLK